MLKQSTLVDLNAIVTALARRDDVRIMPDGATVAYGFVPPTAMLAKTCYMMDNALRTVEIDGRTARFRRMRAAAS